ncbi:MAG: Gfo/Idh/MocA family oxidoreductase [Alphaproteobacteria bacterium]|nr:Gfo/Idh/MocA family oxidoreductase [Alphaproteobacteria bacterium]
MNSLSIAVVGCGYWGKNLVRNFKDLGALTAVCDRNSESAQRLAAQYGVPARTFVEILADGGIDGVVIATPAETHGRLVREALLGGKHVFVEKPLALSVAEARELCALAESRGLILMVGHLLRHHPAFCTLARLCADGELGKIRYLYSHRLNLGKFRTEENALWSFAPHDISMILALVGEQPSEVTSVGHCYLHRTVADVTSTHLTFPSGAAAHVFVSWLHPFKEQRLVVVGDKAMAVFDDTLDWSRKIRLYDHDISWQDGVPHPNPADERPISVDPAEPLRLECGHFLECVRTGTPPTTDGHEGVRVLAVLDAAQRALESREPVPPAQTTDASDVFIHPTAVVDQPSSVGTGTRIWHFSHVLKDSIVGQDCNIGQNVVIGPGVTIGNRCKIQNNVSVYPGVTLEDGVFCGPSMVFTNVINPRAEIERKHEYRPTLVRRGATIGANATIVCGHTVGRFAMVGAGAVVTHDVPDHALVVGNPARVIGGVCRCGARLPAGDWTDAACPACGDTYRQEHHHIRRVGP